MKQKVLSLGIILALIIMLVGLTGCGEKESKKESKENKSSLSELNSAIEKVLDSNEELTAKNLQKNMKNWVIVEVDASPTTRNHVAEEISEYDAEYVWEGAMWITVYNKNTNEYKDVRIYKNTDGKLFAGSEAGATGTN